MPPRPSSFKTVTVPNFDVGGLAIALAHAEDTAVRVVIRSAPTNIGTLQISFDATELNTGNGTYFWPFTPGQIDVMVLAAGQILYALATGGTAIASVAQSDAFPITIRR